MLRQTNFSGIKLNVLNNTLIKKEYGRYIGTCSIIKEEFDKIRSDHYSVTDSIYNIYENIVRVNHIVVNPPFFSTKDNEVELYPQNYSIFTDFNIPKVNIPYYNSKVKSEFGDTHHLHSIPHLLG